MTYLESAHSDLDKKNANEFKPRRSFRRTWMFFAIIGLFCVGGGFTMFRYFYPGLAIAGFFCGIFIYLLLQVLAWGSGYSITKEGISTQRLYKKYFIPWERIQTIALLNEAQAAAVCLDYQQEDADRITTKFRAANRLGQLIEFCTVNIGFHEKTTAYSENHALTRMSEAYDFVLVTTVDKKSYLLSPQEAQRFLTVSQAYRRSA